MLRRTYTCVRLAALKTKTLFKEQWETTMKWLRQGDAMASGAEGPPDPAAQSDEGGGAGGTPGPTPTAPPGVAGERPRRQVGAGGRRRR